MTIILYSMHTFLSCIVSIVVLFGPCQGTSTCTKVSDCSCTYSDDAGGATFTVDLTTLGNSDGTPKFGNLVGQDTYIYDVNMCYPMNLGAVCQNAAVCQTTADGATSYIIGDASSTEFSGDDLNNVIVIYTAVDGTGVKRTGKITLTCDPNAINPTMNALGETVQLEYDFTMATSVVCPSSPPPTSPTTTKKGGGGGGGGGGGESGGISIGTILLIVALALTVVYLIAGVAFMRLRRNASGKEMIPNVGFWSSVPGLIKDGFVFAYRKIRGKSSYSAIR